MGAAFLSECGIEKKLRGIVERVSGITVEDSNVSLFDYQYGMPAETFVYILLKISKEFGFNLNDEFINSLQCYSFAELFYATAERVNSMLPIVKLK